MKQLTKRFFLASFIVLFILLSSLSFTFAGVLPTGFTESNVVTGLTSPVGMAFLPDGRILVIEQAGAIKLVSSGTASTLLTVTGITTGGERGLLGIAVDPDYPTRPYIYVYYTAATSPNYAQVARYTFSNNTIDPNSKLILINDIPDNASNHNGGTLRFGLDKTLYISVGDDASSCDAQNRTLLKGNILRIKVDDTINPADRATLAPVNNPFVSATNNNEKIVFAYGLRNPFRFNIHPDTGALFIGDVGQSTREEVDISTGGENFGWPYWEGNVTGPNTGCGGGSGTMPIYDYTRGASASVIGGVVYKGVNYPNDASLPAEFNGNFFFNDYYTGNLRVLRWNGSSWNLVAGVDSTNFGTGYSYVSDWTVGPDGAIYYVHQGGSRIVRIAYSCNNCSGGGGGDTGNSGGGNTSSGGSGCGFVKDTNGKGQGAKGEGLSLILMLIITLAGIAIVRKIAINKGSKGVEHIKRMIYLSLFFFVIFCIPVFANAADYYVATNGNDSNPGTEAQPWQHIAWATCGGSYLCPITTNNPNKLKGGDTLYIRGGTYNEYNIRFTNSGTATQPITIKNYPGETPIIDGGFSNNLAGQSAIGVFESDGASYITFDGLEIMRGWRANIYLGRNITTSNIIIQNCVLHDLNAYDNSGHVFLGGYASSNITIRNNKMYKVILTPPYTPTSASGDGVFITGVGSYIVENNEMYDLTNGLYLKYKQKDNSTPIVRNNLIHDISYRGIWITANYASITNNIIYNVADTGIRVYDEASDCSGVGGVGNVIMHNTIVDSVRGIALWAPSACTGTLDTIVKDNITYNFANSEHRGLSVWPYYSVDNSNTTFDHNLIYSSNFDSPIRVLNNYYTTATAPLSGTGNIQQAPIFKDYANKDFTLMPNSPGYKAASDGYDMGADTSLPPTPTPDGGGGNNPPPSSSSGGDSSASGGSGCGFVKDNGKGQGAKGEGIALMIMLIIALCLLPIAKRLFKSFNRQVL